MAYDDSRDFIHSGNSLYLINHHPKVDLKNLIAHGHLKEEMVRVCIKKRVRISGVGVKASTDVKTKLQIQLFVFKAVT